MMKYILYICFLFFTTCKKAQQPPPLTVATPTNHTITLNWFFASTPTQIHYTYPSGQQNYLISKSDTIYQTHSISYSYPQGIPNAYSHYMDAYSYNSQDSIEVQILIDGVLKARKKDVMYVNVNYNF